VQRWCMHTYHLQWWQLSGGVVWTLRPAKPFAHNRRHHRQPPPPPSYKCVESVCTLDPTGGGVNASACGAGLCSPPTPPPPAPTPPPPPPSPPGPPGTKKWSFATGGRIWTTPTLSDGAVLYFGSADNHLYAIRTSDANPIWNFTVTGNLTQSCVNTPALSLDGATMFFASGDSNVYAVNTVTSTKQWNYSLGTHNRDIWIANTQHRWVAPVQSQA
jgi:hypothetical protein